MKYKKYKTEEEKKKKKKKILAILLPILFGITAAVVIPTTIILTKKQPVSPDPGPTPQPEPEPQPYTGPTFKFDGTVLLGFCDEVTTDIILERFPDGSITIPECSEIASGAFDGKIPSKINQLILPSNTLKIGDNAFANNKSISEICFYEDKDVGDWLVKEFGKKAFYNTGLTSFVFPPNLIKIGDECFNKCNNLCYMDFIIYPNASVVTCCLDSFSNLSKEGTIFVRKGSSDLWKASLYNAGLIDPETQSEFSKYWKVIEFSCLDIDEDGICYGFKQDIPKYLQFLIAEESKQLVIPKDVKHISNSRNGFNNNLYIEKIIFSSSVESIDTESFKGCTNLTQIDVLDYETVPSWSGSKIFKDCAEKGVVQINNKLRKKWRSLFENTSGLIISDDYWKVGYDEFALENCLCAKVTSGTINLKLQNELGTQVVNLQYLKNNEGDWKEYSEPISLNEGDVIYLKGDNKKGWNTMDEDRCVSSLWFEQTTSGASISLGGSIMGLINNGYDTSDVIPCDGCFKTLFMSNLSLTEVSSEFLSPSILKPYCYYKTFSGCQNLIEPPLLPATTMEKECYGSMFYQCYTFKHAPELKSTQLAPYCYENMFGFCIALLDSSYLPATTLEPYCYSNMFDFCNKMTTANPIDAQNLAEGCCYCMFSKCYCLETAPELLATELKPYCYKKMFYNCKVLNSIKINFNTWVTDATTDWLGGTIASIGQFSCPVDLERQTGSSYIPTGWIITTI